MELDRTKHSAANRPGSDQGAAIPFSGEFTVDGLDPRVTQPGGAQFFTTKRSVHVLTTIDRRMKLLKQQTAAVYGGSQSDQSTERGADFFLKKFSRKKNRLTVGRLAIWPVHDTGADEPAVNR